jgi:hypothetical protein
MGHCSSYEGLPLFGGQEDCRLPFVLHIIREGLYAPGGRIPDVAEFYRMTETRHHGADVPVHCARLAAGK